MYNAAGSSVVLLPGGLPVQIPTQSFVLVNPHEIPQTASIIAPSKTVAAACNLVGVGGSVNTVPNPVPGSYIVLPPTTSLSNTMSLAAEEVGKGEQVGFWFMCICALHFTTFLCLHVHVQCISETSRLCCHSTGTSIQWPYNHYPTILPK